jgi:hypothetical protein
MLIRHRILALLAQGAVRRQLVVAVERRQAEVEASSDAVLPAARLGYHARNKEACRAAWRALCRRRALPC